MDLKGYGLLNTSINKEGNYEFIFKPALPDLVYLI
jgi:hypothetical protein